MNRLAIGVLAGLMVLSACASLPGAQVNPAVAEATFVKQTLEAMPTLTLPPQNTAVIQPTATFTRTPSQTPTVTSTIGTTSPTVTSTAATGTAVTGTAMVTGTISATPTFTVTVTGTPPTPGQVTFTATDLMVPRFYGTQPPYIHYGRIKLVNQAKAQVYVSFQCKTPDGYNVIVEYPVGGSYFKVSVPAGRCIYVAWVGGRQFEGSFGLGRFEELTMTFKKQSVTIH